MFESVEELIAERADVERKMSDPACTPTRA